MRRYIVLIVSLGLTSLMNISAQASCSVAPDKPLLTIASDVTGIEFKVSPSSKGCAATSLNFTYVYFDKAINAWEKWTTWAVGSNSGKSFSFKVPAIKGKTKVAFATTAVNKWGTSSQTRENQAGNGLEFQIVSLESVFEKDVYRSNLKIGVLQVKLRHPEFVECGVHSGFVSDNCRFDFTYDLTTDVKDSKDMLGTVSESMAIDIVDDKGVKIGSIGRSAYQYLFSYGNNNSPISASANVEVETRARFKLPAGVYYCGKLCREITSKEIIFKPITQDEANKRKAAVAARAKQIEEETARFEAAQQAAKKLTITCTKGKLTRKVTGESPSCPAGYKNPLANFATFQAYSACQLYKKDALYRGAQLKDGGRTLILDGVKESSYSINSVIDEDYQCAIRVMKIPAFVESRIEATRALDGIQSAQWGKVSAFWNFHPDNGLNISFNSR
jgi:hypothetical protein